MVYNFLNISGVAIMLSITIFATIVGEMLPVSDATPLIGGSVRRTSKIALDKTADLNTEQGPWL